MSAAPATNRWVLGARPRTLPAAVAPVLVGTAVAAGAGDVVWWRALACLVVALALQVFTNFANDYSDGVRGTDTDRVGPTRLVASGLATAGEVKRAAVLSAAVAVVAGVALAVAVGPEMLAVGAASLAAGWWYTGGSRPYGYAGLGEPFVFTFFGLVATAGSAYVHLDRLTGLALAAAVPVGFLVTAILVANNLRDIPTDAATGKRTLAVRLGDRGTRTLYTALVVGAFAVTPLLALARLGALLALAAAALAVRPLRVVRSGATGPALIAVLADTGKLELAYAVLLAVGLWATA
jgi:1,4-dihydroxy-2-naphthoate octaprenyltransferase